MDLALGAVVVVAFVLIVEALGTYAFQLDPAVRAGCVLVILALIATWALAAVIRPAFRPRTILAWPVAFAVLTFTGSVLGSARPRLSLEPALIGVLSALTLLALMALLRSPTIRRFSGAVVILLPLALAAVYIVLVIVEWTRWWSIVGSLSAPPLRPSFLDLNLGSPNVVATYMLTFTPLAMVLLARRLGAAWAMALLALTSIALVMSGSRSGFLGAAAAALVVGVLGRSWIWALVRTHASVLTHGRGRLVLAGVAMVGLFGVLLVGPGLLSRLSVGGADYRAWYWRSALDLLASSPFLGTGPGTWAQLKLANALPSEINFVVPHAHNLVVQTVTEVGLLGTLGIATFGAAVVWRARRAFLDAGPATRLEVLAAVAGLTGLLAQQTTDYLMNLPGVAFGAALLVAWIDTSSPLEVSRRARSTELVGVVTAGVLGAVVVIAIPTMARISGAMFAADAAGAKAVSGDWPAALTGYEAAVAQDPDFALYRVELADAQAHLGQLAAARETYTVATSDDLYAGTLISLAAVQLASGDPPGAAQIARTAAARDPWDPTIALNAGRILEAAGLPDDAIDAYSLAVRDDLPLASSDYWREPARTVTLDAVISRARGRLLELGDRTSAALASAYAGRIDEARMDVASMGGASSVPYVAALVEGIGGDRASGIAFFRDAVARSPSDFQSLVWLVRMLRGVGDPEADQYAAQARLLREDEADGAMSLLVTVPAAEEDRHLATPAGYPFAVYGRRGLADMLPPQVLAIGPLQP